MGYFIFGEEVEGGGRGEGRKQVLVLISICEPALLFSSLSISSYGLFFFSIDSDPGLALIAFFPLLFSPGISLLHILSLCANSARLAVESSKRSLYVLYIPSRSNTI